MSEAQGIAEPNGLIVFLPARHDWHILPRTAPYGHVVAFIRDSHHTKDDRWLQYCARPGMWLPTVVLDADLKNKNGEPITLEDAIREGVVDLDLDSKRDASCVIVPWTFPSHHPYRPMFAFRRTSTGQIKWLAGIRDWRVRRPADLHLWLTNPKARKASAWRSGRGLFWITWQTLRWTFRALRWALRSRPVEQKGA